MQTIQNSDVTIIPDFRFKYEIDYLLAHGHKVLSIRVFSCDNCRKDRGWIPNHVVDRDISECELDDYHDFDCFRFNCPHGKFIL